MMKHVNITLVILSLFSFNLAYANHTICKSGATERKVEVASANAETGVPCEVEYTKNGEGKVLWSAQNDAAYCAAKAKGLVDKLSAAGWKCTADNHATEVETAPAKAEATAKTHKKMAKKQMKQCTDKKCSRDKPCKKCAAKKCSKCKKGDMKKEAKEAATASDAKAQREAKKAKKKAEREAKKAKKKAEREAKKAKAMMKKEATSTEKKVEEAKK